MKKNTHRATAARFLLFFAGAFLVLSLFVLRIKRAENLEWLEFPTALGDQKFYTYESGFSENSEDFWNPNLKFQARSKGLYRRNHEPQSWEDGDMYKVGMHEETGLFVYSPVKKINGMPQVMPDSKRRFFLKTGDNLYIEFGEQKYYPRIDEMPEGYIEK